DALPDYSKLVALRPNDPASYERRGTCYLLAKDLSSAEQDFLKLLELRRNDPNAHYRLSIIYRVRRQYAEAVQQLQRVRELAPQVFRATLMLSHVHLRSGNPGRAFELLDEVAPSLPQDPATQSGALTDRGDVLRALERWDDAAAAYERSIEFEPHQVDA